MELKGYATVKTESVSEYQELSVIPQNCVTILDINSGQLSGPAYQGKFLAPLGQTAVNFPSDHTLLLLVQSVLANISSRLNTYNSLKATHKKMSGNICRMLDVYGCDADIIQHLSKIFSWCLSVIYIYDWSMLCKVWKMDGSSFRTTRRFVCAKYWSSAINFSCQYRTVLPDFAISLNSTTMNWELFGNNLAY